MNEGLKITFEVLSKTKNEAAVNALIAAMDSPHQAVREGTLRAILARHSPAGQREVVRRLHTLDERGKTILDENRGRLTQALRDALLSNDQQMSANGCQGVLWFRDYDLIPTLINAVEDASNPHTNFTAETLVELSELVYDEVSSPRDYSVRRDPQLLRRNVTSTLEQSVKRFPKHRNTKVITAFLIVAHRDNGTLRQILSDPRHPTYLPVVDALAHATQLGVMRLLLSFLEDPHPPSAAINTLVHRGDYKFVRRLLRKLGRKPSDHAVHNLRRIEHIPWLERDHTMMDRLDDACQHAAVQLASISGMKRDALFEVITRFLKDGKPQGRRAAVAALASFNGSEANELAVEALEDPDPEVQAGGLAQLRQRGVPGALPILIEQIDSPHEAVREAARASMAEFSFKRFLAAYDMLDDEVRTSTGLLVKKVDPSTLDQLREQLESTSRTRRLRALSLAGTMDVITDLEEQIIARLTDRDHMVRAEAARALGQCRTRAARAALEAARGDSSVIVQEAVDASLEILALAQFSSPPPSAAESSRLGGES